MLFMKPIKHTFEKRFGKKMNLKMKSLYLINFPRIIKMYLAFHLLSMPSETYCWIPLYLSKGFNYSIYLLIFQTLV